MGKWYQGVVILDHRSIQCFLLSFLLPFLGRLMIVPPILHRILGSTRHALGDLAPLVTQFFLSIAYKFHFGFCPNALFVLLINLFRSGKFLDDRAFLAHHGVRHLLPQRLTRLLPRLLIPHVVPQLGGLVLPQEPPGRFQGPPLVDDLHGHDGLVQPLRGEVHVLPSLGYGAEALVARVVVGAPPSPHEAVVDPGTGDIFHGPRGVPVPRS
mmetsp:Transcript_10495/g.22745  ORF Transcript_10495/g.22745 Transcript_10495/m.22745 type:complete len:211 (-) Transcript_10495:538-1170(-)